VVVGFGREGAVVVDGGRDGGASGGLDPPGGATTIGTSAAEASLPASQSAPLPASAAIDHPASSAVRPTSIAPRGGLRGCMVRLRWSWSD
jgi:hypothetical protein